MNIARNYERQLEILREIAEDYPPLYATTTLEEVFGDEIVIARLNPGRGWLVLIDRAETDAINRVARESVFLRPDRDGSVVFQLEESLIEYREVFRDSNDDESQISIIFDRTKINKAGSGSEPVVHQER